MLLKASRKNKEHPNERGRGPRTSSASAVDISVTTRRDSSEPVKSRGKMQMEIMSCLKTVER